MRARLGLGVAPVLARRALFVRVDQLAVAIAHDRRSTALAVHVAPITVSGVARLVKPALLHAGVVHLDLVRRTVRDERERTHDDQRDSHHKEQREVERRENQPCENQFTASVAVCQAATIITTPRMT